MIRQIVSLHIAYNTLYTDWKMQYHTIGWEMASCNINNRHVPSKNIFTTPIYLYVTRPDKMSRQSHIKILELLIYPASTQNYLYIGISHNSVACFTPKNDPTNSEKYEV